MSVAPAPSRYAKCAFPPTCCEPSNIMCSNRCANPVRPGRSFAGPTWYQRFTETSGSVRSSDKITSSPFFSLYFSNGIVGSFLPGDCAVVCALAPAISTAKIKTTFAKILTSKRTIVVLSHPVSRRPIFQNVCYTGNVPFWPCDSESKSQLVCLAQILQEKLCYAIHKENSRRRIGNTMPPSRKWQYFDVLLLLDEFVQQ